MLEVRNLAFAYAHRSVLRDVSFVVSPGEVVSIVGANGAGKTTLLRILATLAVPDAGQALVDGQDAFQHPLRHRRQVGYLGERTEPDGDLSPKEYLLFRAALKGEPPKRIRRRVSEAIEMCRLGDSQNEPVARLSVGLRRRVALADALLLRPRVLLLDDFLAGLDAEMRAAAGAVLTDAAAFSSVIVTGHELADFARWTTRFLVLRDGIIRSSLPTAGLDVPELLSRLSLVLGGDAP